LIDFANVTKPNDSDVNPDKDLLSGIEKLITLLKEILKSPDDILEAI
jgi:hypothetical protein